MKYNWNNDKGTHEVFGFSEGDESWEVKSNTSQLSKFHTATFPDNWNSEDYEPRYPDDYTDNTKLKAMTEFIYSTWQDEATGNALASPVTYDGVQYTTDTAAYRLAKFKDGFPDLYDMDNATFFYVFTLVCLLADDRQKNEFLTYWHEIGKWWELPYDFDTALGTDNRGNLTFEYWMEDIDQFEGEYVFNGADNVKWVNFRQAFWEECRSMYQRMRSSGMFDAAYLKNYFRAWQSAWPTQIWNEDGDYKYVKPLEKDGTTTYLTMAYGSKRWQREEFIDWRIPYIDSMFDVGEALLSIMFRPFYQVTEAQRTNGEVDIEVEVYKKSYVTVLWDATKVTHRVVDDTYKCTVENPLAFANDAVCSIHNGKMVRDVKGLEKLYVGFWDSTNAPNLQALRLGSGEAGYRNTATKTVSVGANEKLVYVDMRNCVNFGTADQKTLDLAHCKNIQEVYLDGTACMGVDLPNGGVLEILHLPATTTSIVLRNHPKLTDIGLSVASYNSIDQLWLENMTGLDTLDILRSVPEGTAIRITGYYWEAEDAEEIEGIFDLFDSMIGLDINSEEVEKAQLSGTIHTSALRGDDIAAWNERYPTVTVIADSVASYLYYKTWDGSQTLKTVTCVDGVPQDTTAPAGPSRADTERFRYTFVGWNTQQDASTAETGYLDDVLADRSVYAAYSRVALTYLAYKTWDDATLIKTVTCVDGVPEESSPSGPARTSTAQYDYSFVGWNLGQDAQTADASCITNVSADRTVYAAYSRAVRQYTVTWMNAGNTTITTETYNYGDIPSFKGTTPTYQGQTSTGWLPAITAVTGNITYTAQYRPVYTVRFVTSTSDGGATLQTSTVAEGDTPVYTGTTPTTTKGSVEDFTFNGWTPTLGPVYADTTYTAVFLDNRCLTVQYLMRTLASYESTTNTKFGTYAFANATALTSATAPATTVEAYAFSGCTNLETVDLSATSGVVTIAANAFNGNSKLTHLIIRSSTMATLSNTSALTGTQIQKGYGAVYVPSELVATYKANTNWKNYFIAPISSYPLSDFSTVTDSWAEIIANQNYASDYSIGDTKMIDFGTYGKHFMELVAFDTDNKADESGKARMTWISKTLITTHVMNSTNITTGGWKASAMRAWLKSDILPLLPQEVQNGIVPVTKVSATYSGAVVKDSQTTTDDVWIPSNHEVGFGTDYETTGPVYSAKFTDSTSRTKNNASGSASSWWLRSASSASGFRLVGNDGSTDYNGAYSNYGVVLGFCI